MEAWTHCVVQRRCGSGTQRENVTRTVHDLAVRDDHVPRSADERDGVRQALRTGGVDESLDVCLPRAVGAGNHPQAVRRVATVQLSHEIEAVGAGIEFGAGPVGPAVLVPSHRSTEAWVLDPDRLIEGYEVLTVDRRGDREQLRMAIQAEARVGELEGTDDQVQDLRGRPDRGGGLHHLHRVPAFHRLGAPERVGQRGRPRERERPVVGA